MGAFCKVVDITLLLIFLLISVVAPLFDAQACLTESIYPEALVRMSKWYADEYQDYLVVKKPCFFVGLIWLELVLVWPLALLNVYWMLASKSWLNTTCRIFGASLITSMSAMLGERLASPRASDKLLIMSSPFLGFGVLALMQGLVPQSTRAAAPTTVAKGPVVARKKRA